MRILKFGGKSLETPQKVQNVCAFIKKTYKKDKNLIIVVSAMGKNTDNLIAQSKEYCSTFSPRELDALLSSGETQSASIVASVLCEMNVPAKSFQAHQLQIKTFGGFTNSRISSINKTNILKCFNSNTVVVVAGFQGINSNGETTTLGRGGSDTTACALGAVFNTNVEIYSDFNGIFCGDPRLLNFKKIKKINHSYMQKMADAGAKVLDKKATKIASDFNINIICKSSAEPNLLGSIVTKIDTDIVSVSHIDDLCQISIVFSNPSKFKNIAKNVINLLNNFKFYNLSIKSDEISFIVNSEHKNQIIKILSKKNNLCKIKRQE